MTMQVGEQVKLASMPNVIFKIIKKNTDGSFEVEAKLGNQHISYTILPLKCCVECSHLIKIGFALVDLRQVQPSLRCNYIFN